MGRYVDFSWFQLCSVEVSEDNWHNGVYQAHYIELCDQWWVAWNIQNNAMFSTCQ